MPSTSSRESETHHRRRVIIDRRTAHRSALLLCIVLLAGCSIGPTIELDTLDGAPRHAIRLDDVPFFAQHAADDCGPAALAGVLAASGVATDPLTLSPQVYLPERRGSVQIELIAATRRAGRLPYLLDPAPQALLAELAAGRPVLVFQNLGTHAFPAWHYAVLTGVDPAANRFYLNTGKRHDAAVSARAFLRTWDGAQRWAMVALRPGELPAQGNAERYLAAAADFDAVARPAAATAAWQAAREHWPGQALPYLALGNLAYASADLPGAADHFAAGLLAGARHPALANNLASVLGELGCPRRGEAVLKRFAATIPAQSPWQAALDQTRRELGAQPGDDPGRCATLLTTP